MAGAPGRFSSDATLQFHLQHNQIGCDSRKHHSNRGREEILRWGCGRKEHFALVDTATAASLPGELKRRRSSETIAALVRPCCNGCALQQSYGLRYMYGVRHVQNRVLNIVVFLAWLESVASLTPLLTMNIEGLAISS